MNQAETPTRRAAAAKRLRVLIADDHPLIVEGLTTALARYGIDAVGRAGTAEEVLARYEECHPDVVVLDVRFGEGRSGLEAARELMDKDPGARVVFYSQFDTDEIIQEAYRRGGSSFITKNTPAEVVAKAIEQAAGGKIYFLPQIAVRLATIGVKGKESPLAMLSPREVDVFRLMALGRTNNEIAEELGLSPKTISMTSHKIKETLQVHRPAEVTLLAVKYGAVRVE